MTNENFQPGQCENIATLLANFLSNTNANEVSENLISILDSHIQNEEITRLNLANNATLVNKIISLFYNIEKTLSTNGVIKPAVDIIKEQCLHN